jgi:feruloyl-CoA synthase
MASPYRAVRLGPSAVRLAERADGTLLMQTVQPLGAYPARLTERLAHWARRAPSRTFLARRDRSGAWQRFSYAMTLARVRAIGQALLARELGPERPIAILSGNDPEHALLALAALHVGIPYAPISPAYSLLSTDHAKLRAIIDLLTPGLVFAASGRAFGRAIAAAMPADAELVLAEDLPDDRPATPFAALARTAPSAAVDAAHAATGPDSVAKILFTSGSTGLPKGVINTQRMLCSNQAMLQRVLAFLEDQPPVLVDWLPWHHTFGGNHNIGLTLVNGGTLHIDDGKPTATGIVETVRNLREIAPTVYFNVPKGFEELIPYLRQDQALRARFFSRLQLLFFAGAGMARHVWDALDELAIQTIGQRVLMLTGLGATESAPFALCCNAETTGSGVVGLPVPGVELKLVPVEGKLEARLRGPSITPGYWRQPDLTAAAFDEEGFYRMGDAVRFLDPADRAKGFAFDGRLAEDFKLSSGTWVSVGPLRARLIAGLAPLVADVVIAGPDRDCIGVLLFPDRSACRRLAPQAAEAELLRQPAVRAALEERLAALARAATGSSNRVARALVLEEPPSIDAHEVTDKGTINQRAVLARRAALVEALYATPPAAPVIVLDRAAVA